MRQINAAPQQYRVCAAPLQAFSRAYTPVREGFGSVTLMSVGVGVVQFSGISPIKPTPC